jgi:aminoglycoside 6'-N-acetyltransferase
MQSYVSSFPARLESDRVYLRPYRASDAAWYCEVARRNHEHLTRFESGNAAYGIRNEAAAAAVLRSFDEDWKAGRGFLKASETFVAQIYVGVTSDALPGFCLGFFADHRHEGKGYVTEAARTVLRFLFDEMAAHGVALRCDDTNKRCCRVAERCGFRREGQRRQDKRHADGSVTGSFCYGLSRAEWETARPRATGHPSRVHRETRGGVPHAG